MVVHVAELKVSINPSFVSSRIEVLERLGHVLVDMASVQIHQTQSSLTDRIVTIRRLFKVVERGRVVLRYRFRAFQVHLQDKNYSEMNGKQIQRSVYFSKECHGMCISCISSSEEIIESSLMILFDSTSALVMQLSQTELGFNITLFGLKLVVAD